MAITLVTTPADPSANSYATVAEADAYHETRLHDEAWLVSGEVKNAALVMATRLLDAFYSWTGDVATAPQSARLPKNAFFAWTGAASTETQNLCWPRTGMYTRNGYAIPSGEVPNALKDATAEFAMQLITADRSLDSDVSAQGITEIKAGSLGVKFKDMVESKVMPDAVHSLLVPSWTTVVGYTNAIFKVL